MEVRYTLTVDEYVAFCLHAHRRSGVGRGSYFVAWVAAPIFCVIGASWLLMLNQEVAAMAAVLLVVIGCVFAAVYPFVYRAQVERSVRAYAEKVGTHGITGPITLILSEESLTEITATTRSEVKWANMQGIEEVGDRTYIYITGASAAVLPRFGFEADEDYEAVRDFAMRKLADRVRE